MLRSVPTYLPVSLPPSLPACLSTRLLASIISSSSPSSSSPSSSSPSSSSSSSLLSPAPPLPPIYRHAAQLLDLQHPAATVHCAMAKRASTTHCAEVCDEALQLLGGYGYLQAYEVERYVRDVRYGDGWMDGWIVMDRWMDSDDADG